MKAIIPVAGKGTRMRPHTLNHPKVLLPVAGKPMIDYIIDQLSQNGIRDLIFIVGFLGDQIESHIKEKYPDLNSVFVEQKEMLGLGHAVSLASEFVDPEEEVFIVLGDTLFDVDFGQMIKTRHSNLGVKFVEDPSRFGVAVVEKGIIKRVVEKPTEPVSNLALVGLYFIKESGVLFESIEHIIDNDIRTRGEYQLTDALQLMMEKGIPFEPFKVENWYDCGKPETLLETTFIMLAKGQNNFDQIPSEIKEQNTFIPPVHIHPESVIKDSVIGPNVVVGRNSEITRSVISNSIIYENTRIKYQTLDSSIIGNYVLLSGDPVQLNLGDYSEITGGD